MRIDIRVPEVRSLLGDTGADLEDLETERTRLTDAASRLQEALTGCTGLDTGISRVHEEVFRPDATDIMIRCNNAVQGTGQAVSAYLAGDTEMVQNAQSAAASGEFPTQTQYGVRHAQAVA
ncbi:MULTISPECIES: DUF6507 family protein [Arthrobacter]|uniref:DUF6507 family protein n=1 Tax=Arthrobacter jinronghuae TaxID=2964609 RepID=A0ABT1NVH2_9MICC|nr:MULTISPECIES: DUF6507 family protein [Arthrobacter]MCQ1950699.1 DUF6507 family protein [Arthrobacter jinronghuae]MCQ1954022.1 DUF6507 family protein [Arthrobacter sp. zg-Y238]UWX79173.1 DUF6507 family protein [Arthrobacter jinronghuae]